MEIKVLFGLYVDWFNCIFDIYLVVRFVRDISEIGGGVI